MRILIATDSFKDALPAAEVCEAIAAGIRRVVPQAAIEQLPLADGGEGTAEILTAHRGGEMIEREVHDPLLRPIKARYGWVAEEALAFVDMAQASGLPLLETNERNPLKTSTFGTGELVLDACRRGARKIVLGIGGSATNDGGMGLAAALGYRFLDQKGEVLAPVGEQLEHIKKIDDSHVRFDAGPVKVEVITDVDNPLCGPRGATRVYAPQKGATPPMVEELERGMRHFGELLENYSGKSLMETAGAGAAGGLGAGAVAFMEAELVPGIEAVMDLTRFSERLESVDLIITGEGRLDTQTLHGKLIQGICRRAKAFGLPVIALCGSLEAEQEALAHMGLAAAFSILPGPMGLQEALRRTPEFLSNTAAALTRVWTAASTHRTKE